MTEQVKGAASCGLASDCFLAEVGCKLGPEGHV